MSANIKMLKTGAEVAVYTKLLPASDLGVGRASKRLVKLDVLAALL